MQEVAANGQKVVWQRRDTRVIVFMKEGAFRAAQDMTLTGCYQYLDDPELVSILSHFVAIHTAFIQILACAVLQQSLWQATSQDCNQRMSVTARTETVIGQEFASSTAKRIGMSQNQHL